MLTNVRLQPVAPAPVNPMRPRPQPMLTNVRLQPVAPAPVNPMRPRPQPMLTNVRFQPVAPAPQPIVKNHDLVTPVSQLQPTIANPDPIPLATQPIVKNLHRLGNRE